MSKFVLSADAGGSKTIARGVWSADGAELELTDGPCVPCVDMAGALACIDRLKEKFETHHGSPLRPVDGVIALASAGVDTAEVRHCFETALRERFATVRLVTDGEAALLGCVGDGDGAVISIGTGVAARSRLAEFGERSLGGWGWPAGDRGGGAWLGRRAVEGFLDELDGGRLGSDLLCEVVAGVVGSDRDKVFNWLATADRAAYAALAKMVVEANRAGSWIATDLLKEAGARINVLVTILNAAGHKVIHLTGGLADALAPHVVGADIRLVRNASFAGAQYLAAPWLHTKTNLRQAS